MPGPQVKRWDIFEAVRKRGASKEMAAKIANARAKAKPTSIRKAMAK